MTIRDAIQTILDAHDDGWSVSQFVVCMALERVVDGRIESTVWHWSPAEQAFWMTRALVSESLDAMDAPGDD